jgi:hypothetical protein
MRLLIALLSTWLLGALLLLLLPGCTSSDEGNGDGGSERTLCPIEAPPERLAVCVSFESLEETDLGELGARPIGDPEVVQGRHGLAMAFDGVDDQLLMEDYRFEGNALTLEAWVRPDGPQEGWASIIDFWQAGVRSFWLGTSCPGGAAPCDGTGWEVWTGNDYVEATYSLASDGWQHLAGVHDGRDLVLYLNGAEAGRQTNVRPIPNSFGDLNIGGAGFLSEYFRGVVDEVLVWSEARTQAQICADGGGEWGEGGCQYSEPVAEPPGPCAEIESLIAEWVDWQRGELPAGVEEGVLPYLDEFDAQHPDFDDEAEAWMSMGTLALVTNARELAVYAFLKAAEAEPDNPVHLSNVAAMMLELGYTDDARECLACSLYLFPTNATAVGNLAYSFAEDGDLGRAIDEYERAAELDEKNPEWRYQAAQTALESGDQERADRNLRPLTLAFLGSFGLTDYRGVAASDDPEAGFSFCCPCDGTTFDDVVSCVADCPVNLGCFVNICEYSGICEGPISPPFHIGIKLCHPPTGVQVCFSINTQGNIALLAGASVLNGYLGIHGGVEYSVVRGDFNIVIDAGLSRLPINTGASFTISPRDGSGSVGVGLSERTTNVGASVGLVRW